MQSYYVLLFGLIPGFTLVFGSILLGIHFLTAKAPEFAPLDREVGYLPALNWSLAYAVFLPAALYLMTESLQGIADALENLHVRGMVKDSNGKVVIVSVLPRSWEIGTTTRSRLLVIFGVLIPTLYSLGEWFPNNFLRLFHKGPIAKYPDYDWGLAGLIHAASQPEWSFTHRLLNATFDLLAFSTEGLLMGVSFAFFIILLDLGRVLPGTQRPGRGRNRDLVIVPDARSRDPRRGFEIFAEPLKKALGVALLMYLILYCVRLEGSYMNSPGSPSLAAFVQNDIWLGVVAAAEKPKGNTLVSVLKYLFSTADQTQTVRGILAWLMAVLVFTFSLIVVVMTIQQAASRAKAFAEQSPGMLSGGRLPPREKNKEWMVVWPLGYLKLSNILAIMLLATCTLYLYRIGLFVAGFVVAGLFLKLVLGIVKPGNKSDADANMTTAAAAGSE